MPTTLFKPKYYRALGKGRQLTLAFWFGALLSYLTYALALALMLLPVSALIMFFSADNLFSIHSGKIIISGSVITEYLFTHTSKYALLLALLPTFMMLMTYFDACRKMKQKTASTIAQALGAKPCTESPRDKMFTNIVTEMSIASGIAAPETFVLRRDIAINAFVLSGTDNSLALTVSQGALDCLNRDELQAVIAHEFAHIKNEDLKIYRRLSAMLQGYYCISEFRNATPLSPTPEAGLFSFADGDGENINILSIVMGITGYFLYLYGRILQAAFSRQRELMADAGAVQYTRHAEALVNALKKALALQYDGIRLCDPPLSYAHIYFIRYNVRDNNLLATHPSLESRIAEYGGYVTEEELQALLFDMQETNRANSNINSAQYSKEALTANNYYPLLSIDHAIAAQNFPRPANAAAALLALFIYYTDISLFELKQNHLIPAARLDAAQTALNTIEHTAPLAQIPLITHLNQAVTHLSKEEQKTLNQDIKSLLSIHPRLNRYQACTLICLQSAAGVLQKNLHYRDCESGIAELLMYLAQDCAETCDPKESYQYLLREGLPITTAFTAIPVELQNHQQLCHNILFLRQLAPLYRQTLLTAIQKHYQRQKQITLQGAYLRYTLQYALRRK